MAYRRDREGDRVADQGDSYAPRDDGRSEATYCHDSRDRVQRAVDRVLVRLKYCSRKALKDSLIRSISSEQVSGVTPDSPQSPGAKTDHFGLLATAVEPSCGVHTVAHQLMLLREMGRRNLLQIL
jgi:hypothetical protein